MIGKNDFKNDLVKKMTDVNGCLNSCETAKGEEDLYWGGQKTSDRLE